MNVLLWTDLEGVSGVTVMEQIIPGELLYEEGRRLYTEDINAAIRGAAAAGATYIVVREAHGGHPVMGVNHCIPELLDERCEWVSHHYGPEQPWLDDVHYDACVMVGMHARWGVPDGILCHTIQGGMDIYLDDRPVGEIEVFGRMLGAYGTPVVAVTGDAATIREAQEVIPGVTGISVKRGFSMNSGQCIAPARARQMIEAGVKVALENKDAVQPLEAIAPTRFKVRYHMEGMAGRMAALPNVSLLDENTILVETSSYNAGLNRLFGWANLA
jgi:D-amino peptidase